MTIECYEVSCKYHGCHTEPDEGPFCYERTCRTPERWEPVAFKERERIIVGTETTTDSTGRD